MIKRGKKKKNQLLISFRVNFVLLNWNLTHFVIHKRDRNMLTDIYLHFRYMVTYHLIKALVFYIMSL